MLRDHGGTGREFPEVVGNTTSAFGLGDWEWILAFESPKLDSIVDVIRLLRAPMLGASPRWRSRS